MPRIVGSGHAVICWLMSYFVEMIFGISRSFGDLPRIKLYS
jgi:hypothetical protein